MSGLQKERVAEARKQILGLKQSELASVMGLEPVTVSRWERGVSTPNIANLRQLAKLSRKPISWFFEDAA